MFDKPIKRKGASLTNPRSLNHRSQNPLDILILGLNWPISMQPVRRRSVMLNAILLNLRSDEFGHPGRCQSSIGSGFHPLGEIVNGN